MFAKQKTKLEVKAKPKLEYQERVGRNQQNNITDGGLQITGVFTKTHRSNKSHGNPDVYKKGFIRKV